ncbi:MAG: helix-turn-helix domain-containing protein [Planctomycetota bacterium]|nr:helix-turn-helix domain-containing protein [Planctomycetota bacterium]
MRRSGCGGTEESVGIEHQKSLAADRTHGHLGTPGGSWLETARAFLVTADTVASWIRRVDEAGPDALVQIPEPVNKFPDFVRAMVQRFRILCPAMGKVKLAETLARAGLYLGVTTMERILKGKLQPTSADTMIRDEPAEPKDMATPSAAETESKCVFTAKYANHVWHVDLTNVSILDGFWTSWLPFALPQCWPFRW